MDAAGVQNLLHAQAVQAVAVVGAAEVQNLHHVLIVQAVAVMDVARAVVGNARIPQSHILVPIAAMDAALLVLEIVTIPVQQFAQAVVIEVIVLANVLAVAQVVVAGHVL